MATSASNEIGAQVVDPAVVAAAIATEHADAAADRHADAGADCYAAADRHPHRDADAAAHGHTDAGADADASPTPDYAFELEVAEKFPTESLAQNVVRIYAYIYSIRPNLVWRATRSACCTRGRRWWSRRPRLPVCPRSRREDPKQPIRRFTNLSVIFVEPQAGDWLVQLLDPQGAPAGPETLFTLTEDETTRELYVRYQRE